VCAIIDLKDKRGKKKIETREQLYVEIIIIVEQVFKREKGV